MSLSVIYTRAQIGVDAPQVLVEVHLSQGLPGFTIVGLPEAAVKESKDRVRSALLNSHFDFPQQRITVNLAPADLPKEGGRFDLPIALGILAASEQIPSTLLSRYEFLGELALSGELRGIRGCIPAILACNKQERAFVLPSDNSIEASLCEQSTKYLANTLLEVCAFLHGRIELQPPATPPQITPHYPHDLADVKGQAQARRALEIAASGNHNILLYGPPGTGKSMLASRLPSIMPQLSKEEGLEVAAVNSVSSKVSPDAFRLRPFRSPHHTSSAIALVGGGKLPTPGEISLSHRGVLFMDEFPEFPRQVLEVLREPLESKHICIARANAAVAYPADFLLVAAMNPCPCGYHNDGTQRCRCTPAHIDRYQQKISGPLLDRIDLHVPVRSIPISDLQNAPEGESSQTVQARVQATRDIQLTRQGKPNSALTGKELKTHCVLAPKEQALLANAIEKLMLSARAYDRILRITRTLADMQNQSNVSSAHISEALSYRPQR